MAIQTFKIGARNERMCDENPVANIHPTVKPIELMRWLVRLVTPPGGLVLDPFAGSGSTGGAALLEGARFLGIEQGGEYVRITRARINHWATVARQEARRAGA
jgi:site-specific DNA-methyltransferase (adenine-specific)